MRDSMHILDQLRERGYEPQEDARAGEDWFDRRFGDRALRVIMDDDEIKVIAFDAHQCVEWDLALSLYVPLPLILAALDAAEREAGGQQDEPAVSAIEVRAQVVTLAGALDGMRNTAFKPEGPFWQHWRALQAATVALADLLPENAETG